MREVEVVIKLKFSVPPGTDLTGTYVGVRADLFDREGSDIASTHDVESQVEDPKFVDE